MQYPSSRHSSLCLYIVYTSQFRSMRDWEPIHPPPQWALMFVTMRETFKYGTYPLSSPYPCRCHALHVEDTHSRPRIATTMLDFISDTFACPIQHTKFPIWSKFSYIFQCLPTDPTWYFVSCISSQWYCQSLNGTLYTVVRIFTRQCLTNDELRFRKAW